MKIHDGQTVDGGQPDPPTENGRAPSPASAETPESAWQGPRRQRAEQFHVVGLAEGRLVHLHGTKLYELGRRLIDAKVTQFVLIGGIKCSSLARLLAPPDTEEEIVILTKVFALERGTPPAPAAGATGALQPEADAGQSADGASSQDVAATGAGAGGVEQGNTNAVSEEKQ